MQVEAVVFDVGRVLYQWQLAHLFEKIVSDPDRLAKLLDEVVTEEWHFEADAGRSLADMVPERIALYPDFEAEIRAYAARFNETIPGPVPGSHALVERLDARGIPLFAITNFGAEFWAGFRPTAPIFDRFGQIVVSGEEKLAKPDPAIFALAQDRFGKPAEAMLFIDDNPANVEAAAACGWQVHHFTQASALEGDLASRGLI
ncbi:MAG: HAD-IA family hydrolase [Erythrobacter sp.]|jgi:2-haloacid dehalogenase|uniref:HAD family hydrolase n=1 Tax=Qipengyuania citrea TaxID=225971 RepID=UPI00209E01BB|nr:HAD-IA family hydrolase [Qipengyuania citrea]MCP2018577.1 2-haloacid dehalogenase [Qipengyuania citrea]MDE0902341.1 HAD-IA family hydrolase [Erythrobacter sp.]|tara:strand:- start:1539 stop:2144 length:606 start_codon:yes stop_codon:yes gene_type:complete